MEALRAGQGGLGVGGSAPCIRDASPPAVQCALKRNVGPDRLPIWRSWGVLALASTLENARRRGGLTPAEDEAGFLPGWQKRGPSVNSI